MCIKFGSLLPCLFFSVFFLSVCLFGPSLISKPWGGCSVLYFSLVVGVAVCGVCVVWCGCFLGGFGQASWCGVVLCVVFGGSPLVWCGFWLLFFLCFK